MKHDPATCDHRRSAMWLSLSPVHWTAYECHRCGATLSWNHSASVPVALRYAQALALLLTAPFCIGLPLVITYGPPYRGDLLVIPLFAALFAFPLKFGFGFWVSRRTPHIVNGSHPLLLQLSHLILGTDNAGEKE